MGKGVSSYTHTKKQLDDYANQNNPNNPAFHANRNNHANQCNPNNARYGVGKRLKGTCTSTGEPSRIRR